MAQKAPTLTKKQKEFIEIFKNQLCLVTQSCIKAKTPKRTYYNWLEIPLFREAIEEAKTSIKDFGEAALYSLIRQGNPAAIIFFNKTINRDRGYIEKHEVSHSADKGIQIIIKEHGNNPNQEADAGSEDPKGQ